MFYLIKVLIERSVHALNRPFSYACPSELSPQKGERVEVMFNGHRVIGFIVEEPEKISEDITAYNEDKPYQIKPIETLIDQKPVLNAEMFELARQVSDYYRSPLISIFKTMLPPSLKPAGSFRSKPKEAFIEVIRLIKKPDDNLNRFEQKALAKLGPTGEKKLSGFGQTKTLAALLAKGYLTIEKRKINRLADYREEIYSEKKLSAEQRAAVETVISSPAKVFLLEGVTGSGKTEVFFRLAEHYRARNQSVLILEPEIALTSRLVTIFKSKFKADVAVLHSGETPANLYDEYLRIINGEANIVIGARNAVFAPLSNLGLIVIDEEHVNSYKQENEPFFHSRTVALLRSKLTGAKVLLASATPSLESKARAEKGLYQQLYLTKRFSDLALPSVSIVDLGDLKNIDSDSVIISVPLREALQETLIQHKQALLFLNRRGYAPVYSCRKCGRIFRCPNCDVPLTFHKGENKVKCHHCDYEISVGELSCPGCGGEVFGKTGFGTERIVDEVRRLFPAARVARLDRDIASRKKEFAAVLCGFQDGEYDILIGTQMIAKGHDFKNVELVAALMADKSLSIPSYRASEETFDLLTQLIGRAGRFSGQGRAVIQTYSPSNEVIKLAAAQDYRKFYDFEMNNRQCFQYPPYTYLALITASGPDADELEEFIYRVKNYLVAALKNSRANIYGPSYPYIKKLKNRYYRKLMVKYKSQTEVRAAFDGLFDLEGKDFKITLDIDPIDDC